MKAQHNLDKPGHGILRLAGANVDLGGCPVLHDIHWELLPGQHWAVLGGNGAGKSTLLRLVAGLLWPHPHTARSYQLDGHITWSPMRARAAFTLVSPETQDRYVRQLLDGPDNETGWSLNVGQAVLTGFFGSELLHSQPTEDQVLAVLELVESLGMANWLERPLQTLSQGQLRRVLLARALVARPVVLLLDEACSGLDRNGRHEMLELIERIAAQGTAQVVMTTHRKSEIIPTIGHVLHLEGGRVTGRTERVAAKPLSALAPPATVTAAPAAPRVEAPTSASGPGPAPDKRPPQTPLIRLSDASVFVESAPVLHDLNWELYSGQHWAIAGANGAGKSTFLRLLRGELAPALGGVIERFGSRKRRPIWEVGHDIALVSPALQARFRDELPVELAVASGFRGTLGAPGPLADHQREQVEVVMRRCGLDGLAGKTFGRLSYGQTRRVLLARALVNSPRVLLLDESLDGLDAESRDQVNQLLTNAAAAGTALVVVSHHEEDWPLVLTHVLALSHGRITSQTNLV